jgi:hypothetical protein
MRLQVRVEARRARLHRADDQEGRKHLQDDRS